jgi:hypothetical protein
LRRHTRPSIGISQAPHSRVVEFCGKEGQRQAVAGSRQGLPPISHCS